jgi:hypothetical protein
VFGSGPRTLIHFYSKRWGIEPSFRDTKDLRFGMGMSSVRISNPARRDRLWLLNAFASALLTLLGAAGESLGYDRTAAIIGLSSGIAVSLIV